MAASDVTHFTWELDFSVADQAAIDALSEETRAVVERYVRSHEVEWMENGADSVDEIADSIVDDLEKLGFKAAAEELRKKFSL